VRTLLVLGAIVFALVVAGVIHFQKNGDEINVTIDRAKLRKTSGKLIDAGKRLIDKTEDEISEAQSRSYEREEEFESEVRTQAQRFNPSPRQR
jgi:hypothetical protein